MKKILFVSLMLLLALVLSSCSNHKKGERVYNDTHHWYGCKYSNCDARIEEEAHSWDDGEVIKEPSEGTDGNKVFFCTVCGASKNEKLPALPKQTVTEASWNSAFYPSGFSNVTATLTEKIQSADAEIKIEYTIQASGTLVYLTVIRCENGVEKSYFAKLQDGYYQWSFTTRDEKVEDVTPTIASAEDVMLIENILKNYNLDFTGLYNSFTFDQEKGCYKAQSLKVGEEQMSNVEVYMSNGRIIRVFAKVGNGAEITVTLEKYGTTSPKR